MGHGPALSNMKFLLFAGLEWEDGDEEGRPIGTELIHLFHRRTQSNSIFRESQIRGKSEWVQGKLRTLGDLKLCVFGERYKELDLIC